MIEVVEVLDLDEKGYLKTKKQFSGSLYYTFK